MEIKEQIEDAIRDAIHKGEGQAIAIARAAERLEAIFRQIAGEELDKLTLRVECRDNGVAVALHREVIVNGGRGPGAYDQEISADFDAMR